MDLDAEIESDDEFLMIKIPSNRPKSMQSNPSHPSVTMITPDKNDCDLSMSTPKSPLSLVDTRTTASRKSIEGLLGPIEDESGNSYNEVGSRHTSARFECENFGVDLLSRFEEEKDQSSCCKDLFAVVRGTNDPRPGRRLTRNKCIKSLLVVASALLPLLNLAFSIILLVLWYKLGYTTYFWVAVTIFSISTVVTAAAGLFMDLKLRANARMRGRKISCIWSACGLFISILQLRLTTTLALALHAIWIDRDEASSMALYKYVDVNTVENDRENDRPSVAKFAISAQISSYMSQFKLIETLFEAIPMVFLQAYAVAVTLGEQSQFYNTVLIIGLLLSISTVSSGIVGIYLSWEALRVKLAAFLFLTCMLIPRCCAFVVVCIEFGYYGLIFPCLSFIIRLVILQRYDVVPLFKPTQVHNGGSVAGSSSAGGVSIYGDEVVEDDAEWIQILHFMNSATSWIHTLIMDIIFLWPFVAILTVVPLGARKAKGKARLSHSNDNKGDDNSSVYYEETEMNTLEDRYIGIKSLFSMTASARNTFRNRFQSELAVHTALFHCAEILVATIAVGIAATVKNQSVSREGVRLVTQYTLIPLFAAPLFYFLALRDVEARENAWKADLGLPEKAMSNFCRTMCVILCRQCSGGGGATGCGLQCANECVNVLEVEDENLPQEDTKEQFDEADDEDVYSLKIEDTVESKVTEEEPIQFSLSDTVLLSVLNHHDSWWSNVLCSYKGVRKTRIIFLPDLLSYCAVNFRGSFYNHAFDSLDYVLGELDAVKNNSIDHIAQPLEQELKGGILDSIEVTQDEIEELRVLLKHKIGIDDVRPSLRAALQDLRFALAQVGIDRRRSC